jgi:pimeloyl-ACP methyl ester carboxylesterase
MRCLSFYSIAVFVALLAATALPQQKVPRFEPADCAVEVPATEKNVTCGYLVVPEDRSSSSGRTIRLPIAILKTLSPNPKPDPVLKTLGGPGGSSLRMIRGRSASPWLKDRDYIIFEQRGTRYAQPSLGCPEVDQANAASSRARLHARAARRNEVAAAKDCYDRLRSSGVVLDAYNSAESAADIEDLRRALELEKINLYGVSYSARLMLDVVRYYPAGIRSVVLESTLPPEINYDEVGVDAIVRSLSELFGACRRESECNAAYPDLEREFYSVVSRLNKEPLTVTRKDPAAGTDVRVAIKGNDFVTWIVDYLFSNEPAATVEAPYVIHQAFLKNYVEPFKRDAGPGLGTSFYSWGMRYSVWCGEEIPFEKMNVIKSQSSKYAGLKGYEVMALPDICSVWKVRRAAPVANLPVSSDVPVLIFGAQYDAYTPPEWGKAVSRRFKNSFFFEVPWAGHGPGFSVPCVGVMAAEFIEDPGRAPSSNCVDETRTQFKFLVKPQ